MLPGLALLVAVALPASDACHTVTADRIAGRDLAAAIPALAALQPDQFIGYAPMPGQRRTFLPGELNRIARQAGIAADLTQNECFAWSTHPLDRATLLTALQSALPAPDAELELLDFTQNSYPAGELKFVRSGLSTGNSNDPAMIWRGTLTYAPNRTLVVWARVRITIHEQDLVAAADLKPGDPISAMQVRLQPYAGPLRHDANLNQIDQITGYTPRVPIPAGTPLNSRLLRQLADVERGDTVQVVVQTTSARIEIDGVAEEGGSRGSFVTVRNLRSGRKFRARVDDRGKVSVVPTNTLGLTGDNSKS